MVIRFAMPSVRASNPTPARVGHDLTPRPKVNIASNPIGSYDTACTVHARGGPLRRKEQQWRAAVDKERRLLRPMI
jgi:hypothetical protein